MSRMPHAFVALVTSACLALTGCGSGDSAASDDASTDPAGASTAAASPSSTPTTAAPKPVRPKGAKVIRGTGYSFAMPKGWVNLTRAMRKDQPTVDAAVGNRVQNDGFADNLVVTLTPTGEANTDTIDEVAKQVLEAVRKNAPKYAIRPPASVAGVPAAHLSGLYSKGRQRYWLEQFVVVGAEQTMVIAFSISPSTPKKARDRLIRTVLRSWAVVGS